MSTELAQLVAKKYTAKLPDDELKERICNFLKEQTMCTLATCKEDVPRATPLEYFSEVTTLYIAPDPGTKIVNIAANPRISVGIFNEVNPDWPGGAWKRIKGVQITGEATLLTPDEPEYAHAMKVYNWEPFLKALGRNKDDALKPKKMIKVEAKKIEYSEFALMLKGYAGRQVWEASA
jgi:nitroimidazol reductase NimA-like FMN-containing flavoprotein (pyridoxamine 5'-phosphate oxidase superfamily)